MFGYWHRRHWCHVTNKFKKYLGLRCIQSTYLVLLYSVWLRNLELASRCRPIRFAVHEELAYVEFGSYGTYRTAHCNRLSLIWCRIQYDYVTRSLNDSCHISNAICLASASDIVQSVGCSYDITYKFHWSLLFQKWWCLYYACSAVFEGIILTVLTLKYLIQSEFYCS